MGRELTNEAADDLRRRAVMLCGGVRGWQVGRVHAALENADLAGLCVVLAAMVDPNATPEELLAWTEDTPPLAHDPGVDMDVAARRAHVLCIAVHDWNPARVAGAVHAATTHRELTAMAVTLAAMVDDDTPVDELLAWTEPGLAEVVPLATGQAAGDGLSHRAPAA